MLVSMTGFGAAALRESGLAASVEIKAVNNRYFKLSLRMSDGFAVLEPRIEPFLRKKIDRGTLNVTIRLRRESRDLNSRIAEPVLRAYFEQLSRIAAETKSEAPRLDALVALPGAIETDIERDDDLEATWAVLEKALSEALEQLQDMRRREGESMNRDLTANLKILEDRVASVERQAPNVAPAYRQRLNERISKIMENQGHSLNEADLVREVALFADRCDISEETVRFRSHLEQFAAAMKADESCGRKLDFLTQELFRETNTMGSKANDAEITRHVVEMKTVIERMREMIQNIE